MPIKKHIVFGVHITERLKHVDSVQRLLSQYGCNIKTRLGLHEAGENFCSPNGLLLLEMVGDEKTCMELADKLAVIEGVEVQKMIFDHP
ncbi:MAG: hypothetical protein GX455_03235, partial [Phycisphaerae bacterium]|nr:hypothetical protein [Phycisphaerae bacterium]